MSILLEALRKSERQKRAGEVPGIHGGNDDFQDREPRVRGAAVWVLLTGAFVALAWLAWRQYQPWTQSLPETPPAAQAGAVAETHPATPAVGVPVAEQRPPADGGPAEPDTAAATARARTPVETLPESSPVARDADTDAPEGGGNRAGRSADQVPPRQAAPGSERAVAVEPERAAGQAEAVSGPARPAPISVWELPQSLRNELPAFRITVLVYAEQPGDRFVLLNGRRMVEADLVAPGLTLEEIQRERVIFSYRKYRFYVKQ